MVVWGPRDTRRCTGRWAALPWPLYTPGHWPGPGQQGDYTLLGGNQRTLFYTIVGYFVYDIFEINKYDTIFVTIHPCALPMVWFEWIQMCVSRKNVHCSNLSAQVLMWWGLRVGNEGMFWLDLVKYFTRKKLKVRTFQCHVYTSGGFRTLPILNI